MAKCTIAGYHPETGDDNVINVLLAIECQRCGEYKEEQLIKLRDAVVTCRACGASINIASGQAILKSSGSHYSAKA